MSVEQVILKKIEKQRQVLQGIDRGENYCKTTRFGNKLTLDDIGLTYMFVPRWGNPGKRQSNLYLDEI